MGYVYVHFTGQVSCLPVMTSVWAAADQTNSARTVQCLQPSTYLTQTDGLGEKKSRLSVLILIRLAHLSLLIGDDLPKLYIMHILCVLFIFELVSD